jgi:hypothetical protein
MVVMRGMSVDGVMMMMVVVMRTSNGSLLWSAAGVGREAERMEGSRSVRHLLFWQAVMVMVMARGSCQYQHGRLRRVSEKLTDGRGRDDDGGVGQHVPSLVVCCLSDSRSGYFYRQHCRCPPGCPPSTCSEPFCCPCRR